MRLIHNRMLLNTAESAGAGQIRGIMTSIVLSGGCVNNVIKE